MRNNIFNNGCLKSSVVCLDPLCPARYRQKDRQGVRDRRPSEGTEGKENCCLRILNSLICGKKRRFMLKENPPISVFIVTLELQEQQQMQFVAETLLTIDIILTKFHSSKRVIVTSNRF